MLLHDGSNKTPCYLCPGGCKRLFTRIGNLYRHVFNHCTVFEKKYEPLFQHVKYSGMKRNITVFRELFHRIQSNSHGWSCNNLEMLNQLKRELDSFELHLSSEGKRKRRVNPRPSPSKKVKIMNFKPVINKPDAPSKAVESSKATELGEPVGVITSTSKEDRTVDVNDPPRADANSTISSLGLSNPVFLDEYSSPSLGQRKLDFDDVLLEPPTVGELRSPQSSKIWSCITAPTELCPAKIDKKPNALSCSLASTEATAKSKEKAGSRATIFNRSVAVGVNSKFPAVSSAPPLLSPATVSKKIRVSGASHEINVKVASQSSSMRWRKGIRDRNRSVIMPSLVTEYYCVKVIATVGVEVPNVDSESYMDWVQYERQAIKCALATGLSWLPNVEVAFQDLIETWKRLWERVKYSQHTKVADCWEVSITFKDFPWYTMDGVQACASCDKLIRACLRALIDKKIFVYRIESTKTRASNPQRS